MKRFAKAAVFAALALAPIAALAEDVALVLVGDDYRRLPDVGGASDARELVQMLAGSGFRVTSVIDVDIRDAARAMEDFRDRAQEADRVLIFVSGHIVSTARESWLLGHFAGDVSAITVGADAVPLGALFDIAGGHPGEAVVMVSPSEDPPLGEGTMPGLNLDPPQGVTLLTGSVPALVDAARDVVLVPGRGLSALGRSVDVSGFASDAVPFLPTRQTGVTPPPAPTPDRETAFWDVTRARGGVADYEAYLRAYPDGRYASLARAAIRELEASSGARAEAIEAALGLNRDRRRDVQRDLSLLGYDPRGIDGIFGPGSRAAITAWQRANGFEANGYLTADQLRALTDAAAIRAAELEREAAERKAEEERRDTAYWRATGQGRDEAGLRAYLARYPDGLYSEIAEARLAEIEAAKREQAAAEERAFWDRVRAEDRPESYRAYLERYPNGAFAAEARARLDALTADAGNAAAKAEEQQVAGNGVTRLLVETRLKAEGYDPGAVDGRFNQKTRRAIRQFQRDAGLDVSGYVTRATMVRLLAAR